MKVTIHLDAIVARVHARIERERVLRARGVAVLRDWLKRTNAFAPKPPPKRG